MEKSKKEKIKKVKQFGFYSKGLVYSLIGILAALVAFGLGGDIKGKAGIAQFLHDLPGGIVLTAIVALGLLAHGLWRFYEAAVDPHGEEGKTRIGPRIQFAYSGFFYGAIAYSFAKPLFSSVVSSEGESQKAALSILLEKDWGIWVMWIFAIGMAGNAIWQVYLGISGKFMIQIDENPNTKNEYKLVKRSGRYGYMARGVVFGVISYFLVLVSLAHNANALKDTEGAFHYLLSLPYGSFLMGAVALGMLGFGIFCIMVARHSAISGME
ncbi:uncharacterized protein DUF1206 [Algoriphagus ratkowskyi]|uniref:DUF1206 domain-containing protein n=1 Tax=Algoriphagus ratkowskyi TaxID=57028 RepID=A0A2W7TCY6_9BACT|nr:DUF1206 domain-containing protein [Algoriphagus ratkowskyi]PZX61142.1 uncharacterized protein DUF1206 [Algoriphagus ratkowskyi]TXD79269.1 DUF1206 domain-containing protein [Algoriphagus ratkowskyi]